MGFHITPGMPKRFVKAAMFIDGAFLESVVRDSHKGKVLALRPFLANLSSQFDTGVEVSDCIRTYYYDAGHEEQTDNPEFNLRLRKKLLLLDYLEEHCDRLDVKRGFLSFPEEGPPKQKGVDALLSADIALLAWMGKVDRIILVAADGDYVPAVEVAKRAMTNVYLISDKSKLNPVLKRSVDVWNVDLIGMIDRSGFLHHAAEIAEVGVIPTELMNDKALK